MMPVDSNTFMSLVQYLPYLLAPLGAFGVWLYKQHDSFVDDMAKRLTDVETHRAVTKCLLDNMKEDITEIKQNVAQLVDRSYAKNKR